MPSRESLATIAVFVILVTAPWIVRSLGVKVEGRTPAIPTLESGALADASYFADLDNALVRRAPLRSELAEITTQSLADVSGMLPKESVHIGSDGELFVTEDFTSACDKIETAKVGAGQFNDWNALGTTEVYLVAAPDKSGVYRDRLKGFAGRALDCHDAYRLALTEAFDSNVLIDLWQPLEHLEDSSSDPVFYRSDPHWTPYGATVFVEELVNHLEPGLFDRTELERSATTEKEGAAARRLGWVASDVVDTFVANRPGVNVESEVEAVSANSQVRHYRATSTDAGLVPGHTLVIHDSRMLQAETVFVQYFESVELVHWRDINRADAFSRMESADRVVFESVERSVAERIEAVLTQRRFARLITEALGK